MILDSLGARLDITLSLTISNEIVQSLNTQFSTSLILKGLVAIASFLAFLGDVLHDQDSNVWLNMVRIFRRLSVLVSVQILLDEVNPRCAAAHRPPPGFAHCDKQNFLPRVTIFCLRFLIGVPGPDRY